MKYVVDDKIALSRAPEGPLKAHIRPFARTLHEQGYSLYSIHRHVLLAACFSLWLKRKGVGLRRITSDHPAQYLRRRARLRAGDASALNRLLDFMRREGVIHTKKTRTGRLIPTERCTQAYEHYLREARGLAEATIVYYVRFARSFLKYRFGDGPVTLSHLRAADITRFVQLQAHHLHIRQAKLLTTALRSFLQYARYQGKLTLDLVGAVPVVANWSMSSIPRAIAPDQVRRLLVSVDRRTALGRRDYAILLLLARLGLRSGEVVSLELDDIDWNAAQLTVRGKSGERSELPLPRGCWQSHCRVSEAGATGQY